MSTKEQVIDTIEKMASIHINDPRFDKYYDEIVTYLSKDVNETTDILNSLNEEQISWITTSWEEVAGILQNEKFIEAIKEIRKKYPNIHLIDSDINDAIKAMD